ncbi:MAG: transposase family protein [Pseudomonadota bacterium]
MSQSKALKKKRCSLHREERKSKTHKKREAKKKLRKQQQAQGLVPPLHFWPSNAKSQLGTPKEELEDRESATSDQLRLLRQLLPHLLDDLSKIPDVRNPKKVKHRLTMLMAYGILMFVYQMGSRREANTTMTNPIFKENLKLIFPGFEDMPHHDTLNRLLAKIDDVGDIEKALCSMVKSLIANKKFQRYLVGGKYMVAIDGTQKMVSMDRLSPEWLERHVGKDENEEGKTQYYVYVLEATLVFPNGISIPLMSEFLDYEKGDKDRSKQDCEQRAFHRLAPRLKALFPRLSIMVLLDGLYPNGPVMEACARKYHWDFMIVLQDDSLPSVWEEFRGLNELQEDNTLEMTWGERRQRFTWVNDIEYAYGKNERKRLKVHLVVCEESWEDIDKEGKIVTKTSRHAWISAIPITRHNVHARCNLGGRHRWGIESGFLVEKHHGYYYEHCYSFDWIAMKGYHYLMRIGHALNTLILNSSVMIKRVRHMGLRGFLDFLRQTISVHLLTSEKVLALLSQPLQLRLE